MRIILSVLAVASLLASCSDDGNWRVDLPLASTRGGAACVHDDRIAITVTDPSGNPQVNLPGWSCTCLADGSVGCASDGGKLLITPDSVELAVDGCVFKFHE